MLATVLSVFIPGVGQLYNGDAKKGLVMLVGAIVLSVATVGLVWPVVMIWSAVDAYRVASGAGRPW